MKSMTYGVYMLLMAIAMYPNQLTAQTFAASQPIYETLTAGLEYADISDLDGDGDLDIITAASSKNNVGFIENLGGGAGFAPIRVISDGATDVYKVTAVDLDGDGDLDILNAHDITDVATWSENTGGGNFSAPILIQFGVQQCTDAVAADVDGDGDQDVFTCASFLDEIYFLENLGGAVFAAPVTITSATNRVYDLHLEDLDGDGDKDLLSASEFDYKIAWYENLGGGSFGPQQLLSSTLGGATAVTTGDLDNDGDADVIAVGKFDEKLVWYENLGGTFTPENVIYDGPAGVGMLHVSITDVDGDGNLDLLTTDEDEISQWFRNAGGGSFVRGSFEVGFEEVLATQTLAADFDGDGDGDVLAIGFDRVAYYENTTGTAFAEQQLIVGSSRGQTITTSADLDGDGDIDLLGALFRPAALVWYENLGDNNYGAPILLSLQVEVVLSIRAADFDLDGDMDFAYLTGGLNRKLAWFENLGGGLFGPEQLLSTTDSWDMEIADVDEDGWPDIVAGKLIWYRNLGGGVFASGVDLDPGGPLASEIFNIHFADINGDGTLDILSNEGAGLHWSENLGSGSFSSRNLINAVASLANDISAADLDNDGDIDPICAISGRVTWYKNFSDGASWGSQRTIYPLSNAREVFAGDVDLDGDADVLAVGTNGYYYFENIDGNMFGDELVHGPGGTIAPLHVTDLDGDGDLDIVAGQIRDLIWLENLTIDCDATAAVSGLSATVGASTVTLNWDAVSGSSGCQLNGGSVAPPGPVYSRNFPGSEIASVNFPISALGSGTSWEARVRCLCPEASGISTLTPYSDYVTFSIPGPRVGEVENLVFPNPVESNLYVRWNEEGALSLMIFDQLGRQVKAFNFEGPGQQTIDFSEEASGIYFYTLQGKSKTVQGTFVK